MSFDNKEQNPRVCYEGIEAIAWDLDGTLLDSFGLFEEIANDISEAKGLELPGREFMLHNFHGSLDDTIKSIFGLSTEAEVREFVTAFLDRQSGHYDEVGYHLLTDAIGLAERASKLGLKQLIITNRNHSGSENASPRSIIERSELADFIHDVLCGDEVEFRKPDPRSIAGWITSHSVTPESLLVIGDQTVDAQLALNIGAVATLIERDDSIPHLSTLSQGWEEKITIVKSLEDVEIYV